jgi:hypothetical protein
VKPRELIPGTSRPRTVENFYIHDDVGHGRPFTIREAPMDPFQQIIDEIVAMHDKKAKDYGSTGDPLANVRASSDFGIPAWVGCMVRANDKMKRLQTFAIKGSLVNESVEDSLLDLAVYAIIGLQLYREQKPSAFHEDDREPVHMHIPLEEETLLVTDRCTCRHTFGSHFFTVGVGWVCGVGRIGCICREFVKAATCGRCSHPLDIHREVQRVSHIDGRVDIDKFTDCGLCTGERCGS